MNTDELRKILDEHKVYVDSFGENGSRADLCEADLCEADLCEADLCGANLCGANLPDHTYIIMGGKHTLSPLPTVNIFVQVARITLLQIGANSLSAR